MKGRFVVLSGLVTLVCISSFVKAAAVQTDGVQQQVIKLEERVAQLEAEQESQQAASNFQAYWKEGLNFKAYGGNFALKIGGRLMTDWFWSDEDEGLVDYLGGPQEDGTEVRRARVYFSGTIYDNVEYKLQLDFAGAEVAFKDAYLEITDLPLGKLRMGQFYEPFGLETITSSNYITFLERALPIAFAPERQTGFMLYNTAFDERVYAAVGVFRETDNTGENVDDGGYHYTGRITALPIYENNGESMVHIGAAYTIRNPDETVRFRSRPEAHLAEYFVDTGSIPSDGVNLLGFEGALVKGPFSLQGEYITSSVSRIEDSDVNFDSYYIMGSYFLTGEHRSYKPGEAVFSRVKPNENYKFGGGPGAWELKARYSELNLDDKDISGGKMNDITGGVNWYLNPNTKIMWDYVHAEREDAGDADMLMMRLQFDF